MITERQYQRLMKEYAKSGVLGTAAMKARKRACTGKRRQNIWGRDRDRSRKSAEFGGRIPRSVGKISSEATRPKTRRGMSAPAPAGLRLAICGSGDGRGRYCGRGAVGAVLVLQGSALWDSKSLRKDGTCVVIG